MSSPSMQSTSAHDHVYLIGWPSLKGFIDNVNQTTAHRPIDEAALTQRWLKANAHIQQLKAQAPGCAEYRELAPLPESMAAIAAEKLQDPVLQQLIRKGSYAWKLVELDRLVVYQRTIDLQHVARLRATRPDHPTDEQLIQIAIGRPSGPQDVKCIMREDNVFVYVSHSADIRFLGTALLQPENICGVPIDGYLAGAIGTFIGFGSNICSALHFRNRLMLLNASHRLYNLRSSGVTHAPCLVHTLASEAELGMLRDEVRQNAHLYFGDARPPMFKDYFDPALHTIVPMTPFAYSVQVQVVHQKVRVPIL